MSSHGLAFSASTISKSAMDGSDGYGIDSRFLDVPTHRIGDYLHTDLYHGIRIDTSSGPSSRLKDVVLNPLTDPISKANASFC